MHTAVVVGAGSGLSVSTVMVTFATGVDIGYDIVKGDESLTAKLPGKLSTIADGVCKDAEKIQNFRNSTTGHGVGILANDPPDPAYASVAAPDFTDFGAIAGMPNLGFNSQRAGLDRIRAYAESSLHALERYQGRLGGQRQPLQACAGARARRRPARLRPHAARRSGVHRGRGRADARRASGRR